MIKAIETTYKGYRFRSRLEARWAVFFDSLGIEYQYEPEGFCWPARSVRYLPDFYLPKHRQWVEVKGCTDQLTDAVCEKLYLAADFDESLPGMHKSYGTNAGLILAIGAPGERSWLPALQHDKGVVLSWAGLTCNGFHVLEGSEYWAGNRHRLLTHCAGKSWSPPPQLAVKADRSPAKGVAASRAARF